LSSGSSVLLSFTDTSLGCANVGISRSWRDFQSPVETVLWFPWGWHLHSRLRHRPRSSRSGVMLYPCRRADRRSSSILRGRCGSTDRSNRSETASNIHIAARDTWFYFVTSSVRKSAWTLVRQLLGPHLSTCAWCKSRSSSAVTAAVSPSSLPQSSTGRFDASSVDARS
jgi:hypothetical protein